MGFKELKGSKKTKEDIQVDSSVLPLIHWNSKKTTFSFFKGIATIRKEAGITGAGLVGNTTQNTFRLSHTIQLTELYIFPLTSNIARTIEEPPL